MENEEQKRIRQLNTATIEKMRKQIAGIQQTFLSLKKSGLHRDIIVAYLKDRTGMGKNDILTVLDAQDEFYQKLVKLAEV